MTRRLLTAIALMALTIIAADAAFIAVAETGRRGGR